MNSKKQSSTSRSSCESEYRALAQCSCEAIWIRGLLSELRILNTKPTNIYCDNQSSIKLSYNPVFHEKSKHFQIDYHFTRQKVEDNTIKVEYISSQDQPADILTKSLGESNLRQTEKNFTSAALSINLSSNVWDSRLSSNCPLTKHMLPFPLPHSSLNYFSPCLQIVPHVGNLLLPKGSWIFHLYNYLLPLESPSTFFDFPCSQQSKRCWSSTNSPPTHCTNLRGALRGEPRTLTTRLPLSHEAKGEVHAFLIRTADTQANQHVPSLMLTIPPLSLLSSFMPCSLSVTSTRVIHSPFYEAVAKLDQAQDHH